MEFFKKLNILFLDEFRSNLIRTTPSKKIFAPMPLKYPYIHAIKD